MSYVRRAGLGVALMLAFLASPASAVTFSNEAPIIVNDNGPASPYPARIGVTGLPARVESMRVTLNSFTHSFPDDVDIRLASPSGAAVTLLSDAGGSTSVTRLTLTFDDGGVAAPDSSPLFGTYRPTDHPGVDTFPAPAPVATSTTLAGLLNADPNGVWSLYVMDDAAQDTGSISLGWSLDFTLDTTAPATPVLTGPADGSATNGRPVFTWSAVTDPTGVAYDLNASRDCTFASGDISASGLDSTTFAPPEVPADGGYCWRVRAVDGAGNRGAWSDLRRFVIDTVPPALDVTTVCAEPGNAGWCRSSSYTYEATASDTGTEVTLSCLLDGNPSSLCADTVSTQGRHIIEATAQDAAGNVTTKSVSLGIDSVAPTAAASAACSLDGTNGFCRSAVEVAGSASDPDPGSGVARGYPECTLDGGVVPCATSSVSEQGAHTYSVEVRDAAGSRAIDIQTFEIDTVLPPVPSLIAPTDGSATNLSPEFDWTDVSDTNGVTYDLQADTDCTFASPDVDVSALTSSFHREPVLPDDGSYCWRVRGADGAGNASDWTTRFTVTIDTVAPVASASFVCGLPGSAGWCRSASAEASGTGTDDRSGVASVVCNVDGGSRDPCDATTTGEGGHTLDVTVTDRAGNSASASGSVSIDSLPPAMTLTPSCAQPGNAGWCVDVAYAYAASASDGGSGIGAGSPSCSVDSVTAACDGTVSGQGAHSVEAVARDVAGNPASRSLALGLDNRPPDAEAAGVCSRPGSNGFCRGSVSFTGTASDPVAGSGIAFGFPRCRIDGDPSSCTASVSSQGAHTFRVDARDRAGLTSFDGVSVVIDTIAPVVSITNGPADPTNAVEPVFEFVSEPNATFECSVDGAAFNACRSPHRVREGHEGDHRFVVRATDLAGNLGDSSIREWRVDLTPPETTITAGPRRESNSTSAEFGFFASESPATFRCSIDGSVSEPCTSGKTYSDLVEGVHSFSVFAVDAAGNVDASPDEWRWNIDATPPDTTLIERPEDPNASSTARFTFTSEPGAEFECQLDGASFQSCESPRTYTGLSDGQHTFRVRAVDIAGNEDPSPAVFEWVLDTTGPQVVITRPLGGEVYIDDALFSRGSSSFPAGTYGPLTVRATATDPHSGICGFAFFVDGIQVPREKVALGADGYTFKFEADVGPHEVEAAAINCVGRRLSDTRAVLQYEPSIAR